MTISNLNSSSQQSQASNWLINDLLPLRHRAEDTAPEGSFKTIFGCWLSVCIASGRDIFGHSVQGGNVLIVDNETPLADLENHLNRFSQGLGWQGYHQLPINIYQSRDFIFDRKTELNKLLQKIASLQPIFIRFDSLIAMLPLGRQGINENSSQLGGIIGRDLIDVLNSCSCSTLLAVHSKKPVALMSLKEVKAAEMQSLVRGHGSIVGEGSDTGFALKKISQYPEPTRFVIIPKVRRRAIPAGDKPIYVEMKEESYGKGWAQLKEISLIELPPSSYAKTTYRLLLDKTEHSSRSIVQDLALFNKAQITEGVDELLEHKVIIQGQKNPQSYMLNPSMQYECNPQYLRQL